MPIISYVSTTRTGMVLFLLHFIQGAPNPPVTSSGRSKWCASKASLGWNEKGPQMIPAGFGPSYYVDLSAQWKLLENKVDFTPDQVEIGKELAGVLKEVQSANTHERVLSAFVQVCYCDLRHTFEHGTEFLFLHQASLKCGDQLPDILITDRNRNLQGLQEIKWVFEEEAHPESQAAAYGPYFEQDQHKGWYPASVLTKNYLHLAVATSVFAEWATTEIFSYKTAGASFDPENIQEVYVLLRMFEFMIFAAGYHRDSPADRYQSRIFMDADRNVLLRPPIQVLGTRVIYDEDGGKILKFYQNKEEADQAIERQKKIWDVLRMDVKARSCKGCASHPIGAVLDDYIPEVEDITRDHLLELTRQIKVLHENRLLHGDLRLPNIRFMENGKIALIDCDWSGSFGEARFPKDVNAAAFGRRAKKILTEERIPKRFDWVCLADILESFGFTREAEAIGSNRWGVAQLLQALSRAKRKPSNRPIVSLPQLLLSLGGPRYQIFYKVKRKYERRSDGIKPKRKRARTDGPVTSQQSTSNQQS